jgi:hypothetical protein
MLLLKRISFQRDFLAILISSDSTHNSLENPMKATDDIEDVDPKELIYE